MFFQEDSEFSGELIPTSLSGAQIESSKHFSQEGIQIHMVEKCTICTIRIEIYRIRNVTLYIISKSQKNYSNILDKILDLVVIFVNIKLYLTISWILKEKNWFKAWIRF